MKQQLIFFSLLLSSLSSFAVTDQINVAQQLNYHSNDILVDKSMPVVPMDSPQKFKSFTPKKEIKYGQSSKALLEYQNQNGITPTGKFDDETLAFVQTRQEQLGFNVTKTLDLNTWFATYHQSNEWQQQTIQDSLNQWQQILSKQIAANTYRFIIVDIPSMTLHGYEFDPVTQTATETITSKVVIGKPNSQTPMDDFSVWAIKYNPTWTPTPNMLKKNVYKNGTVNTSWLSSHHIRAINSEGQTVPYSSIRKGSNIRLVQPAGNNNALGILKFETTSQENIYLHDTNEKRLFGHNTRSYSSGCIRVESFKELAQWLTYMEPQDLDKKLKNSNTRIEKIEFPVPVYFTYSQVQFVNGLPIYSPDIYNKNDNTITD